VDSKSNARDEELGTVEDFVTSPSTGSLAYLVISRGDVFGIGEKSVPVPWKDFKTTANLSVLVLETTSSNLESAPQLNDGRFTPGNHFEVERQEIDKYWKAHLAAGE
jgi:hypothetical protein